jgi:hypothetical protein
MFPIRPSLPVSVVLHPNRRQATKGLAIGGAGTGFLKEADLLVAKGHSVTSVKVYGLDANNSF